MILPICAVAIDAGAETLPAPPPEADPGLQTWEEINGVLDIDAVGSPIDEEAEAETETVTERYSSRAVKLQRQVALDDERNYVNHGPWKMWDPKGRMIAEGEYRHGKRHGPWTRILSQLSSLGDNFSPPYTSQAEFARGQLQGTWKITDGQGRPVGSWQFDDGRLHGKMQGWYANGQQRCEVTFADGLPHGEAIYWARDGSERKREHYRRGNQLIHSVNWYDKQQKSAEGWLIRTNINFEVHIDWWHGVMAISRDESKAVDQKTGSWKEWYPNGTVRFAGDFQEGLPRGKHTWWHPNGLKMMAGEYETGVPEGMWTRWHDNGRKQEEGSYLAGEKRGTWKVWEEDGTVADVQHLPADDEADYDQHASR